MLINTPGVSGWQWTLKFMVQEVFVNQYTKLIEKMNLLEQNMLKLMPIKSPFITVQYSYRRISYVICIV